jgi:Transglutaminase-like superfamily
MWEAFQRYRALDPEARKQFRRAVILLPQIALSLRFRGFKRTKGALQEKLQFIPPPAPRSELAAETIQKTCRMVRAGARYGVVRPTCLVESLGLWYLLQRQSIFAILRIGVRKLSDKFEAHAWVEHDGLALNQPEEHHQHYAAFDTAFLDVPGEKS